jgi:hypothetical protein
MSRFALMFVFASTFAFAEPQFYVCRGMHGSAPFTIISNIETGDANLMLAHGPALGWRNGNHLFLSASTMKQESTLNQIGSCAWSNSVRHGWFSIDLPSCDFTPGTYRAWASMSQRSFEAHDVTVACTLETAAQFRAGDAN